MKKLPRFFGKIGVILFIMISNHIPISYAISVSEIDNTILYELYIENDREPVGYYFIKLKGKKITTEYLGRNVINIPFMFNTEKKIIMHKGFDQGLKEMKVGADKYTLRKEKKKNVTMIYKNDNRFIKFFEKIPVLTMEGLIISFIQSDIGKERLCLWFEGENEQKRLLIQKSSELSTLTKNGKTCPGNVVQVNWKGYQGGINEPMFKFFIGQPDHIPLKIQTTSGRWSLLLHSIGKKVRFKKRLKELTDIMMVWKRKDVTIGASIPSQGFKVQRKGNDLDLSYKKRIIVKQDQIDEAVKGVILEKITKDPKRSIKKDKGKYYVFIEEIEVENMLRVSAKKYKKGLIRSGKSYYFEESHRKTIKASQLVEIYVSQQDNELVKLFKSTFNFADVVLSGTTWEQTHFISCK